MALSVFNVLDAATVSQKLPQRRLAFHIGPASQIVAVDHEKIESTSAGTFIVDPTMQRVEVRNPIQGDLHYPILTQSGHMNSAFWRMDVWKKLCVVNAGPDAQLSFPYR